MNTSITRSALHLSTVCLLGSALAISTGCNDSATSQNPIDRPQPAPMQPVRDPAQNPTPRDPTPVNDPVRTASIADQTAATGRSKDGMQDDSAPRKVDPTQTDGAKSISDATTPATGRSKDGAQDDTAPRKVDPTQTDASKSIVGTTGTTVVTTPSASEPGPVTGLSKDGTQDATAPRKVDNSGQNETDKNGHSLTPLDQGTSASDIAITRAIRSELTDDHSLSINAQNLKIIINNGVVVLRGPVASQAEADSVLMHAHKVAGVTRIENQIAVP